MKKELDYAMMTDWKLNGRPSGDRVELIQKDWLGSILVQVILLLFTAGIGNLACIIYRWTQKPYRHAIYVSEGIEDDDDLLPYARR